MVCGGKNAEADMHKRSLALVLLMASGGAVLSIGLRDGSAEVVQPAATQSGVAPDSSAAASGPATPGSERLQVPLDTGMPPTRERVAGVPPVTRASLPERQSIAPPASPLPPKAERQKFEMEPFFVRGIERVSP
jgi:hypothetical protein